MNTTLVILAFTFQIISFGVIIGLEINRRVLKARMARSYLQGWFDGSFNIK